jgi:hypothetical protein
MKRLLALSPPLAAGADAAAIAVFTLVGLLSHHGGLSGAASRATRFRSSAAGAPSRFSSGSTPDRRGSGSW